MSSGGWLRGRCRRSPSYWLQHQEAHPAGLHLPDDYPHAFQQQREVHLWGTESNASTFPPLFKKKNILCQKTQTTSCELIVENFNSRRQKFHNPANLSVTSCLLFCLGPDLLHPVGDPAGDGHPREGAGTSAAVSGLWEAHSESSHQGAQVQGDWERPCVYSQWPVYLQTAPCQDPNRYTSLFSVVLYFLHILDNVLFRISDPLSICMLIVVCCFLKIQNSWKHCSN